MLPLVQPVMRTVGFAIMEERWYLDDSSENDKGILIPGTILNYAKSGDGNSSSCKESST